MNAVTLISRRSATHEDFGRHRQLKPQPIAQWTDYERRCNRIIEDLMIEEAKNKRGKLPEAYAPIAQEQAADISAGLQDRAVTKREIMLAFFRKPLTRSDAVRKAKMAGFTDCSARHHLDALRDMALIEEYDRVTAHTGTVRVRWIAASIDGGGTVCIRRDVLNALHSPMTRSHIAATLNITRRQAANATTRLERDGLIAWTGEFSKGPNAEKLWVRT